MSLKPKEKFPNQFLKRSQTAKSVTRKWPKRIIEKRSLQHLLKCP